MAQVPRNLGAGISHMGPAKLVPLLGVLLPAHIWSISHTPPCQAGSAAGVAASGTHLEHQEQS